MADFDDVTATADELWDYCIKEYESQNPAVQYLFDNFFSVIREITSGFDGDDRLLEVGCGAGVSSLRIRDMLLGQEIEASEIDARYLKKLGETNFPLPLQQESVLALARKDNSYDCVFFLEVLEHLEEYQLALSELFRVSRKYVVVSVPNEPIWSVLNMLRGKYLGQWGNTPGHVNHWSPNKLKALVSRYGHVLKVYTPLPWIIVLAQAEASQLPSLHTR